MKIAKKYYQQLICANRLVAIHLDLNCGAIYERIRYFCEITSQDWYVPAASLHQELAIPKTTFHRCLLKLNEVGLIESKRGQSGKMKWRVLIQLESLEAHLDKFQYGTNESFNTELMDSQNGTCASPTTEPMDSQNGTNETDPYIGTRVRIKKVKKVKENIRKKEDSSKEECKKEDPPKSADADIPPKGNLPIAQPAPSSSKPKRPAEEHALIRNLHWVSEQHRLLCLEEGREVKFHYHQLDPLQDYEASDGSLVWAKFCTGREKLQKSNKAKSWDVDKAISILCKLCNAFALCGEEATLDKFRECADEGKQGFEVSWVRKPKQDSIAKLKNEMEPDGTGTFASLFFGQPKLKVVNPTPKLKVVND